MSPQVRKHVWVEGPQGKVLTELYVIEASKGKDEQR